MSCLCYVLISLINTLVMSFLFSYGECNFSIIHYQFTSKNLVKIDFLLENFICPSFIISIVANFESMKSSFFFCSKFHIHRMQCSKYTISYEFKFIATLFLFYFVIGEFDNGILIFVDHLSRRLQLKVTLIYSK